MVEWCWQPLSPVCQHGGIWSAALAWQPGPRTYRCFHTRTHTHICTHRSSFASRLTSVVGGRTRCVWSLDTWKRHNIELWCIGAYEWWVGDTQRAAVPSQLGRGRSLRREFKPNRHENTSTEDKNSLWAREHSFWLLHSRKKEKKNIWNTHRLEIKGSKTRAVFRFSWIYATASDALDM